MSGLKPVTTGGFLKDVNDNFAALAPVDSLDGLSQRRTAVFTFDAAVAANQSVAAHAATWTLPGKALVVGGVIEVLTTFTSADDSATIAVSIASANDLVTATAISAGGDIWDAGRRAIVPKSNTPESTSIKLSGAKAITMTVGVQALTAGKLVIYLDYYEGL